MRNVFAKVTTAAYPRSLHEEAGKAGVVPQLLDYQGPFPGDQYLVEMEYLDPQQGWVSLAAFEGDWESARSLLVELLERWQACCDKEAVHGDLRDPNIFLRCGQPRLSLSRFLLMGQACTWHLDMRLKHQPFRHQVLVRCS